MLTCVASLLWCCLSTKLYSPNFSGLKQGW
jgi:hypothetical protein